MPLSSIIYMRTQRTQREREREIRGSRFYFSRITGTDTSAASRGNRHSYIQLRPRNSPGKFRRLFEQCRARKLSRRIPIRRSEGQKRMAG